MDTYLKYYDSPIGRLKIVMTHEAVTGVDFADDGIRVAAEDVTGPGGYPKVMDAVIGELDLYFSGKLQIFTVPVRQEATPFRERVYSELMKIPYGETISYKELASRIGSPKAIRAVGGANHNNRISIIVPCHRVVGANGSLTGYGGGIERKRLLLDLERDNKMRI